MRRSRWSRSDRQQQPTARRLGRGAAVALAAVLALPVHVLGAPSASAATVGLEFDTMPAAPWQQYSSSGTASVDNGILTIDSTDNHYMFMEYGPGAGQPAGGDVSEWHRSVDSAKGWWIEARVHVDPSSTPGCGHTIWAHDHSSSPVIVGIGTNTICLSYPESVVVPFNTTDGFHVYRIEKKLNHVRLLVDGVVRIDHEITRLDGGMTNALFFGDGGGIGATKKYWDYFRYDVTPPPPDTTGPAITVASPLEASSLAYGQPATASFTCTDPSGVTACKGTLADSSGAAVPITSGTAIDTTKSGTYVLRVEAQDALDNTASTSASFTVEPAPPGDVIARVTGGGTVSTGTTATPEAPLQTSIKAPSIVTGTISVDARATDTSAPAGFQLFGQQLVIEGPAATVAAPYTMTFTVDNSALAGLAPSDVEVWRNGTRLTGCTSPTAAIPDPCIVSRGFTADDSGDALVTVRTSHFSTWTLGKVDYDLAGPFHPVDAHPTVNTAKAGAAIPVKFKLGGDKGLDVLSAGYPKVLNGACGGAADEVEQTLSADSSKLTYDAASATYTYTWKTAKAAGCKELVLKLRDGSDLRAKFNLR